MKRPLKKTSVKQLKDILSKFPDDYEVFIFPKYTANDVSGFDKYSFYPENVCEQEPHGAKLIRDSKEWNTYFGKSKPKRYEIKNHIAILF